MTPLQVAAPLRRRLAWQPMFVFAVALLVRLIHVWQIRKAPFFSVLMGDARGYDAWGQRIANGDWLGNDVFYQAPLYPYFLGVIYAAAGRNLLLVRIGQAILGSAACALLGLTASRLFSQRAGLVTGMGLALYAPAIFFDGLIQKTVLDVFLVCVALWVLSGLIPASASARNDPERRSAKPAALHTRKRNGSVARSESPAPQTLPAVRWLSLGLVLGALALTRENALVFVAAILLWIAIRQKDASGAPRRRTIANTGRSRLAEAGLLVAGLAIVLVPVAIRNSVVGGGFYVTTSQFGANFYMGNSEYADGTANSLRVGRGSAEYERQDATELAEHAVGRRLTPAEVSSYWTDKAVAFITTQPGHWLKLMMRKFALLWNATEMLDTESQESYSDWSTPLWLGQWIGHFGVLVPLAVLGVWVTSRDRARLWPLYAMAAAYALSVVLFFVYARYRFPLVPFLMIFAAAGLAALPRLIRESPGARLARIAAVLGAVAIFTNWPVLSRSLMRAITEHNLAAVLQSEGRVDEAIEHYRQALAYKPDYAPAFNNLGTAFAAQGRISDAIASYERALSLVPDYSSAHFNLANALLQTSNPDAAADHFRRALEAAPGSVDLHNNLGIAFADKGRYAEAIAEFQKALSFDPASSTTHRNLGSVLASAGRSEEAIAQLRRAVQLDQRNGPAHYDLATLLVQADRLPEAVDELRAALEVMPDSVDTYNTLGIALGSLGRLDEAIAAFQKALALRPDFAPARANLEAALEARRRISEPPRR